MNKRQAKKYRSKVVYPMMTDEFLGTLNQEEVKEARKDIEEYCLKYRHYKHYRDRDKIRGRPCYCYPVEMAILKLYVTIVSLFWRSEPVMVTVSCDTKGSNEGIMEKLKKWGVEIKGLEMGEVNQQNGDGFDEE